ncbi:hypothetical protein HDV00_007456 [Rhizophlyctis rosea]|nr:hypothetical protein HDV00_007456 [Rhizophlyctis rosea]
MGPPSSTLPDSNTSLPQSITPAPPYTPPTYPSTDRQAGLWYLIPHIFDTLYLDIPLPLRRIIATLALPYLLFSLGHSLSGVTIIEFLAKIGRLGGSMVLAVQHSVGGGFSALSGGGSGGLSGDALGGFVSGIATGAAVWLGWKVLGRQQGPAVNEARAKDD